GKGPGRRSVRPAAVQVPARRPSGRCRPAQRSARRPRPASSWSRSFTAAFGATEGQHRYGQPPGLALLVLRGQDRECTVELEAAAQGVGTGGESVDVIPDRVAGQLARTGRGVELRAEEDVFSSPDELFVYLRELVERQVPEPVIERR